MNVRAGLAGSEFAGAAVTEAETKTRQQIQAVEKEKEATIQVALKQADDRAIELARIAREGVIQDIELQEKKRESELSAILTSAK